MSIDSRVLDAGAVYTFQLRLALGTVAPVAPASRIGELETTVRRAGEVVGHRAELVAAAIGRLGERGWRPLNTAPTGREVLAGHGFAGPNGPALPESVSVVKEATPAQVAGDLDAAGGELVAELTASLTARVNELDIPVVVTSGAAELRYSPREYLETFSIRG